MCAYYVASYVAKQFTLWSGRNLWYHYCSLQSDTSTVQATQSKVLNQTMVQYTLIEHSGYSEIHVWNQID